MRVMTPHVRQGTFLDHVLNAYVHKYTNCKCALIPLGREGLYTVNQVPMHIIHIPLN